MTYLDDEIRVGDYLLKTDTNGELVAKSATDTTDVYTPIARVLSMATSAAPTTERDDIIYLYYAD